MKRRSGILLPITSLASEYGIGCFSKEAYSFVDFLNRAGQTYWQILPLGQTGYGDSPYQSFSTFAGNPYLIDLEALILKGYISAADARECGFTDHPAYTDYGRIYAGRFPLLRRAFEGSPFASRPQGDFADSSYDGEREAFEAFIRENASWIHDYALYTAIKAREGGRPWTEWEESLRLRDPEALSAAGEALKDEIRFVMFQQYLFSCQWRDLKKYANERGIRIIGDIPIYVAADSADAWSHPELFEFDEKGFPTVVAGCPPDAFSATGQLWGNPIYRWSYHKETGYRWWIDRIRHAFRTLDVLRIDHFRGFDAYYTIPYGADNALHGEWEKGPGMDLFDALRRELGDLEIIAEDLGYLTPSVHQLLADVGYPGMKVLQFAFESGPSNMYLPGHYTPNSVVYTGTHDNETTAGWLGNLQPWARDFAAEYLGREPQDLTALDFIRAAMMSSADTAIIPLQDWLGLTNEARINTPSTLGDNWKWRLVRGQLTEDLAGRIRRMTEIYDRLPGDDR